MVGVARASEGRQDLCSATAGADPTDLREIDTFDAGQIVAILSWQGVDTSHAAEPVLRDPCALLVEAQLILATDDALTLQREASHDRATAAAHGAVAATDVLMAIDEAPFELNGSQVAGALYDLHRMRACGGVMPP